MRQSSLLPAPPHAHLFSPLLPLLTSPPPALLAIAAPQVTSDQIFRDLSAPKFEWDRPNYSKSTSHILENVQVRRRAR